MEFSTFSSYHGSSLIFLLLFLSVGLYIFRVYIYILSSSLRAFPAQREDWTPAENRTRVYRSIIVVACAINTVFRTLSPILMSPYDTVRALYLSMTISYLINLCPSLRVCRCLAPWCTVIIPVLYAKHPYGEVFSTRLFHRPRRTVRYAKHDYGEVFSTRVLHPHPPPPPPALASFPRLYAMRPLQRTQRGGARISTPFRRGEALCWQLATICPRG